MTSVRPPASVVSARVVAIEDRRDGLLVAKDHRVGEFGVVHLRELRALRDQSS
jgi:hypothetical protein